MRSCAGFMRVFFNKMGIKNIRFKPAYNPYTEVRWAIDLTHYMTELNHSRFSRH